MRPDRHAAGVERSKRRDRWAADYKVWCEARLRDVSLKTGTYQGSCFTSTAWQSAVKANPTSWIDPLGLTGIEIDRACGNRCGSLGKANPKDANFSQERITMILTRQTKKCPSKRLSNRGDRDSNLRPDRLQASREDLGRRTRKNELPLSGTKKNSDSEVDYEGKRENSLG